VAICYVQLKRFNQAIAAYQTLTKLFPKDFRPFMNLGVLLRQMGKLDLSKDILKQASKLDPKNSEILHNLAITIEHQGNLDLALSAYSHVIALKPSHYRAICNQGVIYSKLGKLNEAEEKFLAVLAIEPSDNLSLNNLGLIYIFKKQQDKAKNFFIRAIHASPTDGKGYINCASLNNLGTLDIDILINKLEPLILKKVPFQHQDKALFALAQLYEKKKNQEKIEYYYSMSNNYVSRLRPYNHSQTQLNFKKLLHLSNELNIPEQFEARDKNYIFIVGMPRSGTTLLESILASNSNIIAGDELPFMNEICKEIIFENKEPPTKLNQEMLDIISAYYSKNTRPLFKNSSWLIDKLPHNFQWACMIAKIFPNAKILHCHRDPMDNCWSLYRANFEQGHPYSFSMKSIGRYYAQYQYLLSHFQKKLGNRIFSVNYDTLVTDPADYTKPIFDHIGIKDYQFDDTKRGDNYYSQTTSSVDVQKPISTSSLGGWKSHKAFLEPLLNSLKLEQKILGIPIYQSN
jgi:Flp pilus assembly protein TadD